jgi:hypothetical protein
MNLDVGNMLYIKLKNLSLNECNNIMHHVNSLLISAVSHKDNNDNVYGELPKIFFLLRSFI